MWAKQKQPGFTIVELLIVIVVIGILAAITIVAYNGVQIRARNVQQSSNAKTYLNIFKSYVAINSAYPDVPDAYYCIGVDTANCTTSSSWTRSTALETALKSVVSTLPLPASGIKLSVDPILGYIPYRGGTTAPTLDGVNSAFFIYTIMSPGTCDAGPIVSGTWPSYTSAVPSQGYTQADGNTRSCLVALSRV